jgi:D-aminoacyl-tRNA deacylase
VRLLVQRVTRAEVRLSTGSVVGGIGPGLLVLVGIAPDDGAAEVGWAAERLLTLRLFADDHGKMNLDLATVGGELLVVSQFTLYADVTRGRRPGFSGAASPEQAERLYEALVGRLRAAGATVATGAFGHHMQVESVNDGPVTLWLDSRG